MTKEEIYFLIYGEMKDYKERSLNSKTAATKYKNRGDRETENLMQLRAREQENFANDLQALLTKIDIKESEDMKHEN